MRRVISKRVWATPRIEFWFLCAAMSLIGLASFAAHASTQSTLDELLEITGPYARPSRGLSKPAVPKVPADPLIVSPDVADPLSMSEAVDVFGRALQEMGRAAKQLGTELDPGLKTQRLHGLILAKLDQVIDTAAQSQLGSSSGRTSGQAHRQDTGSVDNAPSPAQGRAAEPGEDAGATAEHSGQFPPGRFGDVGSERGLLRELRVEWGNLPGRLRDELLQGLNERFSPVYRKATEAYYRRLAEDG